MSERGILMSAPMVRAILAGRKTVTRRVVTPQPAFNQSYSWHGRPIYEGEGRQWCWKGEVFFDVDCTMSSLSDSLVPFCPYGQAGDRLWVRETWKHFGNVHAGHEPVRACVKYRADDSSRECGSWPSFAEAPHRACWAKGKSPAQPSIHMPRWASRLLLPVVSVRVERLQAITEADAVAEGVEAGHVALDPTSGLATERGCYRAGFAKLWDEINGARPGCSWRDDPWVWRLEFTTEEVPRG